MPEAVEVDQADLLRSGAFPDALEQQSHPRLFLHAPRGLADEPPGLYPRPAVEASARQRPDLEVRLVPDVNHYTIVLSGRGSSAVAQAVADVG